MISLKDLLKEVEVLHTIGELNKNVYGIKNNSSKIRENEVFVAVKGKKNDGHDYIEDAISNGAIAIICDDDLIQKYSNPKATFVGVRNTRESMHLLVDNYYHNPTSKFRLVGITGTNGKTSVSVMTDRVYSKLGYKTGLIGTIDNYINGKAMNSAKTTPTTPDCCELGELMNTYYVNRVDRVFMEVSSMALKMHRVDSCKFDVAVFTNLSSEHLDDHVTMEDYKESKMKLLKLAPRAAINVDDMYAEDFFRVAPPETISYGIEKDADITARNIVYSEKNVGFDVFLKGSYLHSIVLPIPSRFAVYNALAVLAICYFDKDVDIIRACEILSEEYIIPGRYEVVSLNNDIEAIIDYAHTPVALENLLKSVKNNPSYKNVISVFGCGGNRDNSKRPLMGEIAQNYSDIAIITSDNPRYEDPDKIIDDIMVGIKDTKDNVIRITDRHMAILKAHEIAKPGDVIVIAGKGHETYQIVNGENFHFNDKEEILSADKIIPMKENEGLI